MNYAFFLTNAQLCYLLSADPSTLNAMEQAIRDAIIEGNPPEAVEAIRQAACLAKDYPDLLGVTKGGKVKPKAL